MKGLHVDRGTVYESDFATLKKYREDYYRITLHRMIRRAGYEAEDSKEEPKKGKKNTAGNEEKLQASLLRTKATISELALSNNWQRFVTLTLNPECHDRSDLRTFKVKLSTFIKNYNRIYGTSIKYLLIPELHADEKSYHAHGLLMGLPEEHLHEFTMTEKLPMKILMEIGRGHKVYNWPAYAKAFGYNSITNIRNIENISKYITKYVTKGLYRNRIALNNHLYYCSKGLKRAEKIYEGRLVKELDADYSNDYVKIKTVKDIAEARAYFIAEEEDAAQTRAEGKI